MNSSADRLLVVIYYDVKVGRCLHSFFQTQVHNVPACNQSSPKPWLACPCVSIVQILRDTVYKYYTYLYVCKFPYVMVEVPTKPMVRDFYDNNDCFLGTHLFPIRCSMTINLTGEDMDGMVVRDEYDREWMSREI